MATTKLQSWFPHAQTPIIISAPMLGAANGTLAAAVSKAGGIGMIPGGLDFTPSSPQLATLTSELLAAREHLGLPPSATLPLGVGFLLFHPSLVHFVDTVIPVLTRFKVRAVWFFAPPPESENEDILKNIISALHAQDIIVFFQVGNVAAARQAVRDGADLVVAQGVDAGGHQFAEGSGVVSLVPEVVDVLGREVPEREVVVVAAGGIVDGRGVAAALVLGAEGAVMGTRFLIADEASTPEFARKLLIEAEDGGISTAKSTAHDDIQGTTFWPTPYDGRALVGESYKDHVAGLPLEQNIERYGDAKKAGDTSRLVQWAGAGIGLVKKGGPAGDIVQETRAQALESLRRIPGVYL
ncbi:2-nitropropane dioxygenase [Cercophora newfieldiana]|uniref:2-nitropropane dioxygenase n=1 Tax=Cercophora newfieldiana TaxID=92897 RepID=A0AA39Y1Y3_9PEZI|nr:2-nitropropane dioxygenase [Cercophora newfieldiana]